MRAVVHAPAGAVEGRRSASGVRVFRGVPYALPPVGALRLRPPQPLPPWQGVRPCLVPGPRAPQEPLPPPWDARYRMAEPMSEDCLSLTVWAPAEAEAPAPVLVWVHGGGYQSGSGSVEHVDGSAHAAAGVVVVTVNYRLNALGWCLLDGLFPGLTGTANLGLADTVAALQWVHDNIAAFGGDPGRVTLGGTSSGGISTAALMTSPAAAGLFTRAVVMSSGAGSVWLSTGSAEAAARVLVTHLGVRPGDLDALLALPTECFVPPPGVVAQMAVAAGAHPFLPVVDGGLLPQPPQQALERGVGAAVDLLIGATTQEQHGTVLADDGAPLLPVAPGEEPPEVRAARSAGEVFLRPTVRFADAHAAGPGRTWAYRFGWQPPGGGGARHGIDTPFLFETTGLPGWRSLLGQDPPAALARAYRAALTAFVRTGDPGSSDPGTGDLPAWPPYEVPRRPTMVLDVCPRVVDDPDREHP